VTGRPAAFAALPAVEVAGVAFAAGDEFAFAVEFAGAEGCAVLFGALVVHAVAARRKSDASTSACDAFKYVFILNQTLLK
jgi:hypothetical protein